MKRYGKCCEKYEIIIKGKGLPVQKKKKKGIRRVLLTTCNKSLPCVQPPPLPSNKIGERDRLPDFRDIFLRYHDGDVNENVKKAIRWIGRKTTLQVHNAFLYISLPSLHDYDVKMPNITFYRGRKQATTKFSFFIRTWIWLFGIRLRESSLAFDKVSELN